MSLSRPSLGALALALLLMAGDGTPVDAAGAAARPAHPRQPVVLRSAATGSARLIAGRHGRPLATAADLGAVGDPALAAERYLSGHLDLLGLGSMRELRRAGRQGGPRGRVTLRYDQVMGGIPVIGGELVVQLSRRGDVMSVTGEASPSPAMRLDATIGAGAAGRAARAIVARREDIASRALRADATLAVYDARLVGEPGPAAARLVWRVAVTSPARPSLHHLVLVDATQGRVVLAFSDRRTADAPQRICDAQDDTRLSKQAYPCGAAHAVEPPDQDGAGTDDVADAARATLAADRFFRLRFGRDSIDGAGMTLVSTVRYREDDEPFENAFWDGAQMVYGDGFARADDVVGHELMHGITERTANLLYWRQSGAIDEALSDIFGELIDQTDGIGHDRIGDRWAIGEDLPGIGVVRDMADPPAHGDPDRTGSPLFEDTSIDLGGVHTNSGIVNKAAQLMVDGGTFNGQAVRAMGIDKTAALFYDVATHLLTSGSDFVDLSAALALGCETLTGWTPRDATGAPSPDGPITDGDCARSVARAIAATEMNARPPATPVRTASVCTGSEPDDLFLDTFDRFGQDWDKSEIWQMSDDYAISGSWSSWGSVVEPLEEETFTLREPLHIPDGRPVFLHFRHDHLMGSSRLGGVVEISVDGGPWTDLGPSFIANGYDHRIPRDRGGALAGRRTFGGQAWGYGSSRVSLAEQAGHDVRIRFRMAIGDVTSWSFLADWYLEDVRVYTCRPDGDDLGPRIDRGAVRLAADDIRDGRVGLAVSWRQADASGIARSVATFDEGGASRQVALGRTVTTSAHLRARPGAGAQALEVTATDEQGNPATGRIPFTLEEAGIRYTGRWRTVAGRSALGGATRRLHGGGSASATLEGPAWIGIVAPSGPDLGRLEIRLGGRLLGTVDLYARRRHPARMVAIVEPGWSGRTSLVLRATGTRARASRGTDVELDGIVVLRDAP